MVSSVLAQAILNQQVPDIVGSFQRGQETGRANAIRTLAGQAASGDEDAFAELTRLDPETALQLGAHLQASNAKDLENTLRDARIGYSLLDGGNVPGFINFMDNRMAGMGPRNKDDSLRIREMALQNPQAAKEELGQFISALDQGGGASMKAFAPIVDPETGQLSTPVFNPNTGETTLSPIDGARQLTPAQKIEQEQGSFIKREEAKSRISRIKERRAEYGDSLRAAQRSQANVREALAIGKNASQGFTGEMKLKFSRLFPGIDASDEGALDSVLKSLALEQLQKFKGPTTDFEFGIVQQIAGDVGNSKEANEARLKSLDRANWFAKEEFNQFDDWIKAGEDPDRFAFDFDKQIKAGKRSYSLMDLRDTAASQGMTIDEVIKAEAELTSRAVLRFDANGEIVQ